MSNMDPNETLSALRGFTRDVLNDKYIIGDMPAEDMAELFSALDDWITRGGFLPDAWNVALQNERVSK